MGPLGVWCARMGGDAGAVTSSMRECSHLLSSFLVPAGNLAVVLAVDHMADRWQRPTPSTFTIREAREDDWPQIWPIIYDVITEQQTFAYDPAMSEDDAKRGWLLTAPARGDCRCRRRADAWYHEHVREPARSGKPRRFRQPDGR